MIYAPIPAADIAGINHNEYCFASSPYNTDSGNGVASPPTACCLTQIPISKIQPGSQLMGSCPANAWFEANPNEISTEILKNTIAGTSNFFNAHNITPANYFNTHGLSSPFFLKSQSDLAKLEPKILFRFFSQNS